MKIIMLGAPGAGKGTQAKKIAAKYDIPHISTGDIFRANIKNGTELGNKAKTYMDQGLLVPDELVVDLVVDRVQQDDCKNGYVLDGFPRTIPQAEALDKALAEFGDKIDYAIDVNVPDENIVKRMGGRRACVGCGATYHLVYAPTKTEGICDVCGKELILRDDDKPETVRTTTALTTSPFLTTPPGVASLTVATITSPILAYLLVEPPSTRIHSNSFAPVLSATLSLLSCCIMQVSLLILFHFFHNFNKSPSLVF